MDNNDNDNNNKAPSQTNNRQRGRGRRGRGGGGRGRGNKQNPNQNKTNKDEPANVQPNGSKQTHLALKGGGKKVAPSSESNHHKSQPAQHEKNLHDNKNNNRIINNQNNDKTDKKKDNNNNRPPRGRGKQRAGGSNGGNNQPKYPAYWSYEKCLRLYVDKDPSIVRGKLRVLPSKDGMAFCSCDRGSLKRDVLLESALERNRAMNGDIVFVELLPLTADDDYVEQDALASVQQEMAELGISERQRQQDEEGAEEDMWQDDQIQMDLWNPAVPVRRIKSLSQASTANNEKNSAPQRKGRVVHVCSPPIPADSPVGTKARRIMVGTLKSLQSGTCLFTPNDRLLPQFKCDNTGSFNNKDKDQKKRGHVTDSSDLYRAEYIYHTWKEMHAWPPCVDVKRLGDACSIKDQIQGLLMENKVDHGEFTPGVLQDVENAVTSGVYYDGTENAQQLGWKPTPEMYKGRRDYRDERIFTIDPTTAKDLDDAMHIKKLPDGRVELGVHIADVSAFVTPGSDVDKEALRRATTVYLVDRTVPMLPRPLCEVACSLNENVERLAFSCVWKMNMDGTLGGSNGRRKGESSQDVWYGRTVIKSCARLDYATAQNIIENKVATGEQEARMDDQLWPKSRRPTGGHTIDEVASDVRLLHRVAMARRRLRFSNGALALHGVKLTFQLDDDGETPLKCAPYPIKDSNRLVEEFMLLANYLVAQRLITHAGDRAVLRRHPDPLPEGLEKVVDVAKAMFDFDVDASSSASLHASLVRFGAQCNDEIILKCMTNMLTTPMQNADYFAAGSFEKELWRHFALNIPYYTHFTSPIRRYADVLVHRLLQATIDGQEAVDKFPLHPQALNVMCDHCNEKRLASKMAQERCDIVFLALYLRRHPMKSELGIVMSFGNKAITVFVPSIGINAMLFLDEHKEWIDFTSQGEKESDRFLVLTRKEGSQAASGAGRSWKRLDIKMFTKLSVSCLYKDKPRVDVKLQLEGPA